MSRNLSVAGLASAWPAYQRGLSLIESLVALLVLALGIMGLAGVQARMVAETRTTNSRAIAVSLIDDITNRMLLNRDHAIAGGYNLAFAAPAPVASNCTAGTCTNVQIANTDLAAWRASVVALLGQGGQSAVFQAFPDTRQVGVMIAWPANEGKAADSDATYIAPFDVVSGVATNCPVGSICHLVYVRP